MTEMGQKDSIWNKLPLTVLQAILEYEEKHRIIQKSTSYHTPVLVELILLYQWLHDVAVVSSVMSWAVSLLMFPGSVSESSGCILGSGSVDLQRFLLSQGHRTTCPQIPRLRPAYTL